MDEKSFSTRKSDSSEDVLDFYDNYANTWDQRFGNTESVNKFHKIRKDNFFVLAKLSKTQTAIELGVGTGPYISDIAPKVKKLICIDGSKEMLNVLKAKTKSYKNVELKQLDLAKKLDKFEPKADIVYFFGLIEHIINVDIFINNCKQMLKPGGKIVVVTPNGLSPWYYGIRKFFRSGAHLTSDKYFTRNSLGKVMKDQGFYEDDFRYWGFFPAGIEGFLFKFLDSVGYFLEKTPFRIFAGGLSVSYIWNKSK